MLRNEANNRKNDVENNCFVCGRKKYEFIMDNKKWEEHFNIYHDPFLYLNYIIYLHKKERIRFTETESYIYDKLLQFKVDWVPYKRTLYLSKFNNF